MPDVRLIAEKDTAELNDDVEDFPVRINDLYPSVCPFRFPCRSDKGDVNELGENRVERLGGWVHLMSTMPMTANERGTIPNFCTGLG